MGQASAPPLAPHIRGFAMPQTMALKENRDFKRIYAKGKSRVHALLVTYAMKNRLGIARVGVVSSKKIGKAVSRNRARRVVRAALRECGEIPAGWDVVFVCRVKTVYSKSTRIVPVMKRQLGELLPQTAAGPADERT